MIKGNRNKLKKEFHKQILTDLAGMILNEPWKKELIDLLNKYIENRYNDTVDRLPYKISNIDLAHWINVFISLKNISFNNDLAMLVQRYMNNQYMSTAGWKYKEIAGNQEEVKESVNTMSAFAGTNEQAAKENEDEIKISLINKGIQKKKILSREWIFLIIFLLIGIAIIWAILKYKKSWFAFGGSKGSNPNPEPAAGQGTEGIPEGPSIIDVPQV